MKPGSGKRRCPICDLVTDLELCPEHSMATLLIDAPSPSIANIQVGTVIAGRYVIQRVIGKGGYGAVFEARHTGTGQGVAIKTLAPGLEADDLALRRFFQEARVTSGLRHPNTIRVFDFGQDDTGLIYLAMELLEGLTLKQELKQRQRAGRVFSEREAVEIGVAVTRSLGEAHLAGLVHRDLKPDNIFLHRVGDDDPLVKVLDFGIVKLANSSLTLGSDSGIPGTPAYMSPEQVVKRGEIDGRSDLYSLGIVLYNLVTGTVPFRGADVMQTLYQHVHDLAPDVRTQAKTSVSSAFADLIAQVLSKDPGERPQDARAMRAQLQACLGDGARLSGLGIEASWDSNISAAAPIDAPDADPNQRTAEQTMPHTPSRPSQRSGSQRRISAPQREAFFSMPLAEAAPADATIPARPQRPIEEPPPAEPRPAAANVRGVVLGLIIGLALVAMVLAGFLLNRLIEERDEGTPMVVVPVEPAEPPAATPPPPPEPPVEEEVEEPPPEPEPEPQPERPKRERRRERRPQEKKGDDVLDIKI